MSLRMRSAVSFDLKAVLKRVFSSFRNLQKLSVLFLSCNSAVRLKSFPLRHFSKPFHMRWQDQFLGDPCHLTLCFIVDNWTYQTKLWPCRPANKHQQKERKKWKRVWRHATWPKKSICVFLLHLASMPRIMHPDVWTRVNAENVSIRHV